MKKLLIAIVLIPLSLIGMVQIAQAEAPPAGVTIAVESANFTAAFNRLNSLGIETRPDGGWQDVWGESEDIDIDGNPIMVVVDTVWVQRKIENRIGTVNTPMLIGVNGLTYFSFRVPADRVHVIPENNNPTFTILDRDDRLECGTELEPEQCPWPMVEVTAYDIDGNPDGTTMQGVGRIQ